MPCNAVLQAEGHAATSAWCEAEEGVPGHDQPAPVTDIKPPESCRALPLSVAHGKHNKGELTTWQQQK
eukprot:433835-Pelagomonas_calceolata.AAC.2